MSKDTLMISVAEQTVGESVLDVHVDITCLVIVSLKLTFPSALYSPRYGIRRESSRVRLPAPLQQAGEGLVTLVRVFRGNSAVRRRRPEKLDRDGRSVAEP
ncbi:hypothetical protein E2C01_008692 [Portunus trituberculatus]|uniref:Uncharacterized protein n=1 Tax=Portunus trituberculatus TaxID=210409 RepID=A0A5B7D319_PORTR|nr:hypothetical protein [Portunus trituberculatus]